MNAYQEQEAVVVIDAQGKAINPVLFDDLKVALAQVRGEDSAPYIARMKRAQFERLQSQGWNLPVEVKTPFPPRPGGDYRIVGPPNSGEFHLDAEDWPMDTIVIEYLDAFGILKNVAV